MFYKFTLYNFVLLIFAFLFLLVFVFVSVRKIISFKTQHKIVTNTRYFKIKIYNQKCILFDKKGLYFLVRLLHSKCKIKAAKQSVINFFSTPFLVLTKTVLQFINYVITLNNSFCSKS